MKASAISSALRTLVAARQPVFIWGGPGIGKSAVVRQLAQALAVPLEDVRALLLDPVDLRGLPFLGSDGCSQWATPEFLPKDGTGILFLDELNAAPAMVQASCYRHRGCREPRFGSGNHDQNAHAPAEPVRTPRLRGRFAGVVGVGHPDQHQAGSHCISQVPAGAVKTAALARHRSPAA